MDAREAARLLGGEARGNRVQCPGPGHSKDDRSLTIVFSSSGFAVHSFSSTSDWRECKDYVRTMLGIADDWKPDPKKIRPEPVSDEDRNFRFAMHVWRETQPIAGTIVQAYLNGRALHLSDEISCLRYHPALKYGENKHPAMVCLYRDIRTNEPRGIHRTFLKPDATKLDRKMLGSSAGAAIKLDDDESVTYGLCIGEGVETCLSARQLGFAPTWALMSVQGIADFPVLPGIDALTLLGERDANRANEMACKATARRWLAAEREVHFHLPEQGKDLNDALRVQE